MKGQQAIGTLVIFIALVITAALASFVLVSSTNALQSKSLAVSQKTMEKSTMGFAARQVEGISHANNEINTIMLGVELAPGSDTIRLDDVRVIWTADGGKVYSEYTFAGTANETNFDTGTLSFNPAVPTGEYAIVQNRTSDQDGGVPDEFVESGELYVLGFDLGTPLKAGQDWQIIVRAPYTQDLILTGYAPYVIQAGTVVTLKSA